MDTNRLVKLPSELVARCQQFGLDLAAHYAAGGSPQSRAYSSHGAANNPVLLSDSKVAECVFAMEMGVLEAVKWSTSAPDNGIDFVVGKTRVDVKQTSLRGRFLIWPVRKVELFHNKPFDVLVLVKTQADYAERRAEGRCQGWIGKKQFERRHFIAAADDILTEGTPFVDQDILHRMGVFPGRSDDPREHYCWCGEEGRFGSPAGYFCQEHRC